MARTPRRFLSAVTVLLAVACAGAPPIEEEAARIARGSLLVDTHIDVPYRLFEQAGDRDDVATRTAAGHFDAVRAREGGLDAAFLSIYVPADLDGRAATERAERLIDLVESIASAAPETFALARRTADVLEVVASGRIALPMGMENGSPIAGDLANVEHFFDRGIRYITLAHSENNEICDSSYATERRWGGLSPFGREVVAEMNRLGIMVDVSHVSDETFDDVLAVSRAPVIASHSSCRAFTPGFERNLDDDRVRRLGETGGVLQINFGSAFLSEEANRWSSTMWTAVGTWLEEHGLPWSSPEAERQLAEFAARNPPPATTVADVADHIDHAVALAGIDHVGIGSDFDGVTEVPEGLADVSMYPNLVAELLRRGYSEVDIRKILGGNLMRVWAEVEALAEADRP